MTILAVNFDKYKEIVHDDRRRARSIEFRPWDLKATIPSEQANAELERQKIRDKYALIQTEIDDTTTVQELKDVYLKYNKFIYPV